MQFANPRQRVQHARPRELRTPEKLCIDGRINLVFVSPALLLKARYVNGSHFCAVLFFRRSGQRNRITLNDLVLGFRKQRRLVWFIRSAIQNSEWPTCVDDASKFFAQTPVYVRRKVHSRRGSRSYVRAEAGERIHE